MYKPKLEKDIRCPLEYGLEIFGGKWKSRIICVLSKKKILRYSELKKELVNITDAVLSVSLKELIEDEIIKRVQYDSIPVKVEYSLTEKGYNPVNQIAGYVLSEDPTYITTYNGARTLIQKIDRYELLKILIEEYVNN